MLRAFCIALSRLFDPLCRGRRDARLDDEMAEHLDALRDDFAARGLSATDADAAARRAFGGVDQAKARYRDQRGWPALDALGQDLRFAGRYLLRDRAFAVPVVLVLALGIGVGHMFLTLTYTHVLRGLPIADVGRVFAVSTIDARGANRAMSHADFVDLRHSQRTFTDLAAYANAPVTLGDEGQVPDRFVAAFTTASGFVMAGVRPLIGRSLSAADDAPGAAPTVVLTERVWRSRYGGDAGLVGRDVLVNGTPATVIGVVSNRSGFPSGAGVFLPLAALPGLATAARDDRTLQVFGRLAPATTRADAAAELERIGGTLARQFPATNDGVRLLVDPINYRVLGGAATVRGYVPFIVAGLIVLAVASTNAGNLLLVGAAGRAREVAIRTALGASRVRIARQLLVEALLMAGVGAALGLALSRAGVGMYRRWIPEGILPYWFDYSLNPWLMTALAIMALVTVVVFAVLPALHASRTTVVDTLKDGGRSDTGRRVGRIGGTAFLGVQLGLAIVLVAQVGIATLEIQSMATDSRLDDPGVLTGTVTLPASRYAAPAARRQFLSQLIDRLGALPGVTAVALASHGPVGGTSERRLTVQRRPTVDTAEGTAVPVVDVSPGYFAALGIGLVRGRDFTAAIGEVENSAVIVNERFAALHFSGEEPVGQRLRLTSTASPEALPWRTVVGVVPDIRQRLDQAAAIPIAYTPLLASAPANVMLFVRGTGDGPALTGPVRETLRKLDGLVALDRARSLLLATRDATWSRGVSATLATTVCVSAFVLAVTGLYAVVSHRTARRRREIGVRMALGADGLAIARMVLGTVRGALLLGLVLGLLGVTAWGRLFAPAGPNAGAVSATNIMATVVALLLTVIAGCLLPAGRATRIAPGEALRRE
jgi:predicted permease